MDQGRSISRKPTHAEKIFLVCGITNTLNGSENHFIDCTKELPDLQFPYVDKSTDEVFLHVSGDESCVLIVMMTMAQTSIMLNFFNHAFCSFCSFLPESRLFITTK